MRSRIDMVCPSYSNFSIGITLLHHNGSTVHGWEERFISHSYDTDKGFSLFFGRHLFCQ